MKGIIDQAFLEQPTVVDGSAVSFFCWSRLVQTQKDPCVLKSFSSFLEASKSYLRHRFLLLKSRARTQTNQSSLKCHWGPVSSAGFLVLLLPPQSQSGLGRARHHIFTYKKWVKHCINHSDEGNGAWLKFSRCVIHHCSEAPPQNPLLGRHLPKKFYSLSLLCSKFKNLILFPSPPLLSLEIYSITADLS